MIENISVRSFGEFTGPLHSLNFLSQPVRRELEEHNEDKQHPDIDDRAEMSGAEVRAKDEVVPIGQGRRSTSCTAPCRGSVRSG